MTGDKNATKMSKLSPEHIAIVRKHFDRFDKNKSGTIDIREMRAALESTLAVKLTESMFQKYAMAEMQRFDKNQDGVLQFDEYVEMFTKYETLHIFKKQLIC